MVTGGQQANKQTVFAWQTGEVTADGRYFGVALSAGILLESDYLIGWLIFTVQGGVRTFSFYY